MRVISLNAENFMRLIAIDIEPPAGVVEIAGKNGAGKSSTLDSMLVALAGGDHIPSKPIRKGEKKASIRVKLGDDKPTLIVTRSFAAKEDGGYTTHLTLEAADGARYAKPQTMLDDLLGALTFDPLAFTRMKPLDQLQQLRSFVPGVDFDAIDALNRGDFDKRTDVNRTARTLKARLDVLQVPGDPRHERVDEAALVAEIEKAGQLATALERERAARQDRMRNVRRLQGEAQAFRADNARRLEEIAELEEAIVALKGRIETGQSAAAKCDEAAAKAQAELEALPPLEIAPDTAEIRQRIDVARRQNLECAARERVLKEREQLAGEIKVAEDAAARYTAGIDERNRQKAESVTAAKLPVEGLGFADDEVLMNGLPFSQASHAEKIRVSCAIAAAMNSKLRVMYVHDGSLLDEDSMALLREFAEQNGFQVWVERVATESPVGIVIEDGRVKASAAEAAA